MGTNNINLDHVQTNENFDFKNSFLNDTYDDDSTPYHNIGHNCRYYEQDEFQNNFKDLSKQISFFSHNVRSLPGKWAEFNQLISEINKNTFRFSVIALQEIWNVPKGMKYDLPGYKPFHFTIRDPSGTNGNSGGGIGLWVDENLDFEPITIRGLTKSADSLHKRFLSE